MTRTTRALIGGTFALSALLALGSIVMGLGGSQQTLAIVITAVSGILGVVMLNGDRFEIL